MNPQSFQQKQKRDERRFKGECFQRKSQKISLHIAFMGRSALKCFTNKQAAEAAAVEKRPKYLRLISFSVFFPFPCLFFLWKARYFSALQL